MPCLSTVSGRSENEEIQDDAVLDPIRLVIDNYPEGQTEYLDVANNLETRSWEPEKSRSAENSILREKTLWKNRRKNISGCSRATKSV